MNGKDIIPLEGSSVVKDNKLEFSFIITTSENKKIILQADNDLQRDEWIKTIKQTIILLQDKSRYGRVSLFLLNTLLFH